MTLSADQKRRFARQLLLPEIGKEGQVRLCAARFSAGSSEAETVAALYLHRAGMSEGGAPLQMPFVEDPVDAALVGAFAAVERIKAELGVGRKGTLPADVLRKDVLRKDVLRKDVLRKDEG